MEDPILKKVDVGVTSVETDLLNEFQRIMETASDEPYSTLDINLKLRIRMRLKELHAQLDNSGDTKVLSLRTEEHEDLNVRILVGFNLLDRKVPTVFINTSKQEAIADQRSAKSDDPNARVQIYLDHGPYAPAHQLALLNQCVNLHHDEGQSIEEVIQGRANFGSRELTRGHAQAKEGKARSVDDLKRKLADKDTRGAGASSFAAKELSSTISPANTPEPVKPKKDIAQSPEAIRRKLAERQAAAQGNEAGKATFGSKDLSGPPASPTEAKKTPPEPTPAAAGKAVFGAKDLASAPPPITEKPEQPKADPAPSSGKAVFGSKDISHASELSDKVQNQAEPEKPKPAGKAIFESKDLSDPKP